MGRMKNAYIQLLNEEYGEDPATYMKKVIAEYIPVKKDPVDTAILCPNCFDDRLVKDDDDECRCLKCGQEYIFVENSIRFK